MNALARHVVGTHGGPRPLLEWVAGHKHRNWPAATLERRLELAKRIAAIKEQASRELLLELVERSDGVIEEMHKEFDTLSRALNRISETLDQSAS